MKSLKNSFWGIVAIIAIIGFMMNFNGCSENMTPLSPEHENTLPVSKQNNQNSNIQKIVEVNDGKVKLLSFSSNQASLQKLVTKSAWITPRYGGTLSLTIDQTDYFDANSGIPADAVSQGVYAQTTLQVLPGAVTTWQVISITMDDQISMLGDIDMEFAPHGLVFNTPALLNIEANHLNLTGVDPDQLGNLGIYYYNEESGLWEKMVRESISLNFNTGTLNVTNAQLPHFSRYAIGGE